MDARPFVRASLLIIGGDDPAHLTAAIGIKPDEAHRVGDPLPSNPQRKGGRSTYAKSIWQLDCKLHRYSIEVETYVAAVLARIRGREIAVARLDRTVYSVELLLVLDILEDGMTPALVLSPRVLKALGEMGITLDVAIHHWNAETFPEYARTALRALPD